MSQVIRGNSSIVTADQATQCLLPFLLPFVSKMCYTITHVLHTRHDVNTRFNRDLIFLRQTTGCINVLQRSLCSWSKKKNTEEIVNL